MVVALAKEVGDLAQSMEQARGNVTEAQCGGHFSQRGQPWVLVPSALGVCSKRKCSNFYSEITLHSHLAFEVWIPQILILSGPGSSTSLYDAL